MTDLAKWKKIRESVQKIGWREATEKIFIDPDGNEQSYVTWNRPGLEAAAVIALTKDNQVVIAQQFRQGPELIMDDMPGGLLDDNEDPAAAAKRELLEETGYWTDSPLEPLGFTYRDAYSNIKSYYFLAQNCYQKETPTRLNDEYVVIKLIDIPAFIENAKQGRMTDQAAVLMAYDRLKEIHQEG